MSETTSYPRGFDATSAAFAGTKSVFLGSHAVVEIHIDEDSTAVNAACAARGGLEVLHFTGVNGVSTVELQP